MKFVKINNTNSNIDDYFNAAKNEKPIFSAEEIIKDIQHSPTTPILKPTLFQKIGATKMIIGTFTVIFVAALSVFFINPTDNASTQDIAILQDTPALVQTISENSNDNISHDNISNTDSQSAQPENIYKSNNSNTETSIEFTPIKKEEKKTKKEETKDDKQATKNDKIGVNAIKYIELTPTGSKKLGIELNNDGISIVAGTSQNELNKIILYAIGGLMPEKYVGTEEIDSPILPRLVSTIAGYKSCEIWYNDSVNVTVNYSKKTNSTQLSSKNSTKSSTSTEKALQTINTNKEQNNSTLFKDIYIDVALDNSEMEFSLDTLGLKFSQTLSKDSVIALSITSTDTKTFGTWNRLIRSKSVSISSIAIKGSDEVARQINGAMQDSNIDTKSNTFRFALNDLINFNSRFFDFDMVIDINKLIPIAVACPTKDDPDFKFLIWYEATPAFLDALPEAEKQKLSMELKEAEKGTYCEAPQAGEDLYLDVWRSCNGAIEQMKIAPNPVAEIANVSFILKEQREIVVSLHDLNGNKVATLQTVQSLDKGEQKMSYDISSYAAGMYLIVLQTSNGEQAVQRVIKK